MTRIQRVFGKMPCLGTDDFVYIEILVAIKNCRRLDYYPDVIIQPDQHTWQRSHEIQAEIERAFGDRGKDSYIPDILGFFTCKRHSDSLESGIYLLIDKIRQVAEKEGIPFHIMMLSVFYHELGHLLIHDAIHRAPQSSALESNFEEPFCEMISYCVVYELLSLSNLTIFNKHAFVRENHISIRKSDDILRTTKQYGDRFVVMQRPYPYKWFSNWMDMRISHHQRLLLAETLLGGTYTNCKLYKRSCEKYKVVLLDSQKLLGIDRKLDMEIARIISQLIL